MKLKIKVFLIIVQIIFIDINCFSQDKMSIDSLFHILAKNNAKVYKDTFKIDDNIDTNLAKDLYIQRDSNNSGAGNLKITIGQPGEVTKAYFDLTNEKDHFKVAGYFVLKYKRDDKLKYTIQFDLASLESEIINKPAISFIPTKKDQDKWYQKPIPTDPPALNLHTRWMLEYDFNREDPVLVWKRTNSIAGNTCDGIFVARHNKSLTKGKRQKDLLVSDVVQQIHQIESTLLSVQKDATSSFAKQKLDSIQVKATLLKNAVNSSMSQDALSRVNTQIAELNRELDIVKGFYPELFTKNLEANTNRMKGSNLTTHCCEVLYCVKQSKRLAPTVARDLLISIRNYHPYRDSFALTVEYISDRNLENAGVFTSAFSALAGVSNGAAPPAATPSTVGKNQANRGDKEIQLTTFEKFKLLATELDTYYSSQISDPFADVNIVMNGLTFIRAKMTELLGITDFSEAGIIKRGEDLVASNGDTSVGYADYFAAVRKAALSYIKVAGVKDFENRSILIQNKDGIKLSLNRYRDGVLVSSTAEADRIYNTESGFKVDFSLGLFYSHLIDRNFTTVSTWLQDTAYLKNSNGTRAVPDSIVAIDSVHRATIVRDRLGKFDIGPAVFAHLYWRTGLDINGGLTFGFSINQQALPRFLVGGSLLLGRDSRWVLSGGAAFGQIKDLATGYSENEVIDPTSLTSTTLPTRDVWKSSYFFGLSFNFGGFSIGGK